MAVLEIQNISKNYGKIRALDQVSIDVPQGSIFGILGPNGSGKTTLLSIVLDVLAAESGTYKWFGEPGSKIQRRQIGSLLETPNFYHYLSAVNNLKITQSISGRGNSFEIEKALKQVNLFERRNSRFSTYSLGMKQRLAIAAALMEEPKVLVLDEPTNGLDPVGIAEIRDLIKKLHGQGHTIIMASHLLDEVEKLCTHVSILKSGRLLLTGTVEEVLSDDDVLEVSAADNVQLIQALQSFPGLVNSKLEDRYVVLHFEKGKIEPAILNHFCFDHGIILTHLLIRRKRLEARFFELTNNHLNQP